MKKQDFELLIAAHDVERVCICREVVRSNPDPDSAWTVGLWELWAYGGAATSSKGNVLTTARGERRGFSSLDTAYDFVRSAGFVGVIEVNERHRQIQPKTEV